MHRRHLDCSPVFKVVDGLLVYEAVVGCQQVLLVQGSADECACKKNGLSSVLPVSAIALDVKDKTVALMAAAATSACCSLERVCQIRHCEGTHQCTQPWRPAVG